MKNQVIITIFILTVNICGAQSNLRIKVGDRAPKILIKDYIKNEPSDKLLAGKFILLEFWATWCKSCLEELPKINAISDKYASRNDIVIISLTDENQKKAITVFTKHNFKSIVACDDTSTTHKNFIWEDSEGNYSIPKTILIDQNGIIKWIGTTMKLNDKLFAKFISGKDISVDDETPFDIPSPTFTK